VYDADAAGGRLVALDPATGEIVAMVDIIREDVADLQAFPWEPLPPAAARRRGEPAPPPPPAPDPPVNDGTARYVTIKPDPKRSVHPALGRNRCVEDVYEPGSTFKPFVWSTITELGLAQPDEVFDTEGGRWRTFYGREIQDVTRRDTMTWADVLVNSSNIGMIKAGERLSFRQLHDAVRRFGFGRATGIGLPGEATGMVTPLRSWSKYSHTSVSFGYEIAVTPLQMARAFSAFARPGALGGTIVPIRVLAPQPAAPGSGVVYRVLPAAVAKLTRETMGGVTANMEARLALTDESQTGWRYSIFGKSGTAKIPMTDPPEGFRRPRGTTGYFENQYNTSFIAGGPTENPRLVCVVVIDDPGPELVRQKRHYGAATAGPVVRRFMERTLVYLGAPPSPQPAAVEPLASGQE
jgi:cell division protein FtsI (penicillin-binding protein 3)